MKRQIEIQENSKYFTPQKIILHSLLCDMLYFCVKFNVEFSFHDIKLSPSKLTLKRKSFIYFIFLSLFLFAGCLIAGFLLMTEMATPRWRRWANCLSQVAYGVGIAVQALIAYFVRDWKSFSLLITLLNLPFITYYW